MAVRKRTHASFRSYTCNFFIYCVIFKTGGGREPSNGAIPVSKKINLAQLGPSRTPDRQALAVAPGYSKTPEVTVKTPTVEVTMTALGI